MSDDTAALVVFGALFALVTGLGFFAASWRQAKLDSVDEWGLGGRRFGSIITWFLLGGDLYTAYTFIAVPALVFGAGAIGFFALPYTILVFGITAYTAVWAFALNILVSVLVTLVLRATGQDDDGDETTPEDYEERGEITEDEPLAATPDEDRFVRDQESRPGPATPERR